MKCHNGHGAKAGQEGRCGMNATTETQPPGVAETPIQGREVRTRWAWTEPTVWTDRMLAALENGVKGGQWFSLIDKVWKPENLRSGWERVKRNGGSGGSDGQSLSQFERQAEEELRRLEQELKAGRYEPRSVRRAWIPKPEGTGQRPLGIPTIRDRIVQTALRAVIEPIYERDFAAMSYGFRPGRGCRDALRAVDELLKAGYTWVVDADLKSCFDAIPHERLMEEVGRKIADGRILDLIRSYLQQEVMEGMKRWTPEGGTPQGAVISPLLANIYLDSLDHRMVAKGYQMVRYADDFVIPCRNEMEAQAVLTTVGEWVQNAGLALNPDKTRVVNTAKEGFDFLGYHFERGYRWPRTKSMDKLHGTIQNLTRRTNGDSLETIVARLNPVLRGWFGYFKFSHKTTFPTVDSWVRMRLRSILRKRNGGQGRGRGRDHQRWPNDFFADYGLFSTTTAHRLACQSLN